MFKLCCGNIIVSLRLILSLSEFYFSLVLLVLNSWLSHTVCLCPASHLNDIIELECSFPIWLHSHTKTTAGIINALTKVCWFGEVMWVKCSLWMRLHVQGKQNTLMHVPHTLPWATCIDRAGCAVSAWQVSSRYSAAFC